MAIIFDVGDYALGNTSRDMLAETNIVLLTPFRVQITLACTHSVRHGQVVVVRSNVKAFTVKTELQVLCNLVHCEVIIGLKVLAY